jgi:hypothetical protein
MQELVQFTYPYAATTVLALLRDRGFLRRKHSSQRQQGVRLLELPAPEGDRYRLVVAREARGLLPEPLPGFVADYVQGRLGRLTTTTEWDLSDASLYVGRNTLRLEGLPLRAHIGYWLVPQGRLCVHRQVLYARVEDATLGMRLEQYALEVMRSLQTRDYEYNCAMLQRYRMPMVVQSA